MQILPYSVSRCQDQILMKGFCIHAIIGSILICVSLASSTGIFILRAAMFSFFQTIAFLIQSENLNVLCFLIEYFLIFFKCMVIPEAAARLSNILIIVKIEISLNLR